MFFFRFLRHIVLLYSISLCFARTNSGEGQDLKFVQVHDKTSRPLVDQGESPATIRFEWKWRIEGDSTTGKREATYGWINVGHNLVILADGNEETLRQQAKPLISETFTHQEGVGPSTSIWVNSRSV